MENSTMRTDGKAVEGIGERYIHVATDLQGLIYFRYGLIFRFHKGQHIFFDSKEHGQERYIQLVVYHAPSYTC